MTPEHKILSQDALAALVAERDALQAEVARLSTPPDDAEVHWSITSGLEAYPHYSEAVQRNLSVNVNMWGLRQMVVNLTRLSHALAAETAKREELDKERKILWEWKELENKRELDLYQKLKAKYDVKLEDIL